MKARGGNKLSALFLHYPSQKPRWNRHPLNCDLKKKRERWASRRLTCFLQDASHSGEKVIRSVDVVEKRIRHDRRLLIFV
jgi:hypothetical protein